MCVLRVAMGVDLPVDPPMMMIPMNSILSSIRLRLKVILREDSWINRVKR